MLSPVPDKEAKSYRHDYNEQTCSTKKSRQPSLITRLSGEVGKSTKQRDGSKPPVGSTDHDARPYGSTKKAAAIQAWGKVEREGGSRMGYRHKKYSANNGLKRCLKIFFSKVN